MEKKVIIGYTTGVYDMFHIGHLNILRQAKEQCDYLIVGVTTDELSEKRKGKRPIICQDERKAIVRAIKYVDLVVDQDDMNKIEAFYRYHFDKVFVGDDWKGTEAWDRYEEQFRTVGVDVIYLPHTDGISSTKLRQIVGDNK